MSNTKETTEIGRAVTDELIHFGVKGMRWGVRRDRTPTNVTVSQKGRKKLKAKGGKNQPATSDAIRTKTQGQIARKSGYQALTDDDLRAYTSRLNLEANAKRLDYQNLSPGRKFVKALLGQSGKNNAAEENAKKVKKALGAAATAAAAA